LTNGSWVDVGASEELAKTPLQEVRVGARRIALTHRGGVFGAISGICNHVGGPLGQGTLEGDFITCP
jgi:nitrite reductase/ring-hydroxylating ferredoxin subunit